MFRIVLFPSGISSSIVTGKEGLPGQVTSSRSSSIRTRMSTEVSVSSTSGAMPLPFGSWPLVHSRSVTSRAIDVDVPFGSFAESSESSLIEYPSATTCGRLQPPHASIFHSPLFSLEGDLSVPAAAFGGGGLSEQMQPIG